MISRELLGKVLGEEEITHIHVLGNTINYTVPNHETEEDGEIVFINLGKNINIHELAHKCINNFYDDYIFSLNAYQVIITKIEIGKEPIEVHSICWINTPYDVKYTFQACQWILDNKAPLNKK